MNFVKYAEFLKYWQILGQQRFTDMESRVRRICEGSSTPIIADADTGIEADFVPTQFRNQPFDLHC